MDWHEVAPKWVADAQVKWERDQTIRRMAECGLSHDEISARVGVNALGIASRLGRKKIGPPPVMEWADASIAARAFFNIAANVSHDDLILHPDLSAFTLAQLEREVRLRKRLRITAPT